MASPRYHCGDTAARGPGPGQVLVEVRAAGIQPGEVHIRTCELHERWPATFPSGQDSDLAGVVVEVGSQVSGVAVGDEVLGFTHNRASHAEFVVVDDVVLSSFGVMFFDDPAAAFANLGRALRHGGRLAFACWRTRDENPLFTIGFAGAATVLGLREMPGPGAAFSPAGTGQVGALLSGAGFGGIEFAKADEPMLIGRDVDDVLEYERASPTAAGVLAGLSPAQAAELAGQVRDGLAAYASPDGVAMPGAAWLVTAQAM